MRQIVFVRFPGFYVASERPPESSSDEPLAVFRNGLVLDFSEEAVQWHLKAGISKRLARQRCPGLICVDHNPDHCRDLFEKLWNVFAALTPLVEPVDFHAGYLDLTGCIPKGKTVDSVMRSALMQIWFDSHLKAEWGGGRDRWLAHLAAGENHWLKLEDENAFLVRADVHRLGLDFDLCEKIQRYGILSVADLLAVPDTFFQTHLQIPEREILPFLQRGLSEVQALFPPSSIEVAIDVEGIYEEDLNRAMQLAAEKAESELASRNQQASEIEFVLHDTPPSPPLKRAGKSDFPSIYGGARGGNYVKVKPSRPVQTSSAIETLLREFVLSSHARHVRSIRLILSGLLPAASTQTELWQKLSPNIERSEKIARARQSLERKYGNRTLLSGSDYSQTVTPRFAQLIYARRGLYLP
jgi:hypothetical protein